LLYVILIVFAPLVVFVIPYAVVKHVKSKKEARIREEEERKSEQEYERHKTE
jgi:septation ring formation regulator EzrA